MGDKDEIVGRLIGEPVCHVCKKVKKPYTVIMNSSSLSMATYMVAREDGEICERCDKYYAMTGELKDATEQEFKNAEKASWFARMMLQWWEREKKIDIDDESKNLQKWEGTYDIAKWCRDRLNKGVK